MSLLSRVFAELGIGISDFFALLSGAALWEGFKFFFPDLKNYFSKRRKAKVIFYESLDAALKASDELLGKLESLAKEDFATFINTKHSNNASP
ncbi:MAG: hypothetical protein ACOYXT_14625, partial [Bacteroidota bacterium]